MMAKVPVPVFRKGNFEMYKWQVELWAEVCGEDKDKQAAMLWHALPDEDVENIKTKIYKEMKDDLRREVGVKKLFPTTSKLLNIMARVLKTSKQSQERGEEEKKIAIASSGGQQGDNRGDVTALRLYLTIPCSFTEANLRKEFETFGPIEYVSIVKDKEKNESRGFGYVKYFQVSHAARAAEGCDQTYRPRFADPPPRRNGGPEEDRRPHEPAKTEKNMTRPINPKGRDGERLLCLACGSYRHMIKECQHSWESMKDKTKEGSSSDSLLQNKTKALALAFGEMAVHKQENRARIIPARWMNLLNMTEGEEEKTAVLVKLLKHSPYTVHTQSIPDISIMGQS